MPSTRTCLTCLPLRSAHHRVRVVEKELLADRACGGVDEEGRRPAEHIGQPVELAAAGQSTKLTPVDLELLAWCGLNILPSAPQVASARHEAAG